MAWFEFDQAARLLWRLPVWGPITAALRAFGPAALKGMEVPELSPGSGPKPLDAFMDACPASFSAGAAAREINPPQAQGVYLAGFAAERRCTSVRDPLWARALVLSDGQRPFVIVCLDLIGLSLARTRRIRAKLSDRYADSIMLVCTHNHQSPDTLGLWGRSLFDLLPYRSGLDLAYMESLEDTILDAVQSACAEARPAELFVASGEFDRARRWVHNERDPLLDDRLRVMHLCEPGGQAIASLVQHACHPETLWEDNTRMSADFCAVCCRILEANLGGVGLYANGALGAMVTAAVEHRAGAQEREHFVEGIGSGLGRAATRLIRRSLADPVDHPSIRSGVAQVRLPAEDNPLFGLMHAVGVVEARDLSAGLLTEVSLAQVGPAWLVGLPGEPAPALGLEILARLPGQPQFLFGLCNDELGYLLPPEFFHDARYAYERSMSPGPQAATMLSLALERLAAEGPFAQVLESIDGS